MGRDRTIPDEAKRAALSAMLRRCGRPGCRRREPLEFLPLVPVPRRLKGEQVMVLCQECLERARQGEFSSAELQRWKLRGIDYWENVGAE